jgi:low affinity Fe/Cu permease
MTARKSTSTNACRPKKRGGFADRCEDLFSAAAKRVARASGHGGAFVLAISVVAVWAVTGPFFGYSDTWQLVINTGTTIVTFLMVFLIQNSQNRDTTAIQVKLDELVRAVKGAKNQLLNVEDLSEHELEELKRKYTKLANGRSRPEKEKSS